MSRVFVIYNTRMTVSQDAASGVIVLSGSSRQGPKGDPGSLQALVDVGGSGNRCQVQARYLGQDASGKDLWQLEAASL